MSKKLNRLNVRSKKETLLANAIIRTKRFRKSRGATDEGKKLFNEEIDLIRKKLKQYKIKYTALPKKFILK